MCSVNRWPRSSPTTTYRSDAFAGAVLAVDGWAKFGQPPAPHQPKLAHDGIVAVAVSQPGYGKSDGPPDYCGPVTQEATRAVLAEMRRLPFIDPKRIEAGMQSLSEDVDSARVADWILAFFRQALHRGAD